jgi:hypothetical protein
MVHFGAQFVSLIWVIESSGAQVFCRPPHTPGGAALPKNNASSWGPAPKDACCQQNCSGSGEGPHVAKMQHCAQTNSHECCSMTAVVRFCQLRPVELQNDRRAADRRPLTTIQPRKSVRPERRTLLQRNQPTAHIEMREDRTTVSIGRQFDVRFKGQC